MARNATQTAAAPKSGKVTPASLNHEAIADHIAAFRKRGGRIEVLGNTPLRLNVAPAAKAKGKAVAAKASG
jgi:hypothetical protein